MSITDELRDFAKRWPCIDYVCKDLLAIADCIDAAHEEALGRQAMLSIWRKCWSSVDGHEYVDTQTELARVPVFVWPMPTQDGCFIVEHQDGHCQKAQPYELTFLDSKELFDQYDWSED